MENSNTNNNSLLFEDGISIQVLKDLDINLNIVNTTHSIRKFKKISYEFGAIKIYNHPILNGEYNPDWKVALFNLINNKLKDEVSYSLAILGQIEIGPQRIKIITFGKHLLITKVINFEALSTYIEGQIEIAHLSLESGDLLENCEFIVYFTYREISVLKDIYKNISNQFNIDQIKESSPINKIFDFNSKSKYLNKIPLFTLQNDKFGPYGNKKSNVKINSILGDKYVLNPKISIFIYDYNIKTYKGIVLKNNHEYFKFTDYIINKNDFVRSIDNTDIFISFEKIKYISTKNPSKLINLEKRDLLRDDKYLTFDIECFLDKDNKFRPYSCAWYHPNKYKEYIVNSKTSWDEILELCIEDLFTDFPNYTIYVHNLSSFDSVFMLKVLNKNYKCKTIFKNNRAIKIILSKEVVNEKNKKIKKKILTIKDSLMLLPFSLENLIKSFNISTPKLIFPYYFIKNIEDINYSGDIPDKKYFSEDTNLEEYLSLNENYSPKKEKPWVFKIENSKYMFNDVKSLYQIIDKFSKETYELERINITKVISISSLALKVFLSNYYDKNNNPIYIPLYSHYKEIKKAYYGGRVEVFKPYGENLYYYDVNSLYPYIMMDGLPSGNIIRSNNSDLDFYNGFCYASVNVPENLDKPILPFRDENGNSYNPTGNWTGWFSSEILKYAISQGVKVKIHYGYTYNEKRPIFKSYVDIYYKYKKRNKNNKGKSLISKLLLNSLYGRFGLKDINNETKIVNKAEALNIILKYKVLENQILDEESDLEYIKYIKEPSSILYQTNFPESLKLTKNFNTRNDFFTRNVGIAAMITSKANIFMDKFINLENNNCYYTDTDSVVLEKPLDNKYIGEEIGQFKLVGKVKKGYFISPKLYYLILENGQIIKKSKGIPNNLLQEEDFIKLSKGEIVEVTTKKFFIDPTLFTISLKDVSIKVSPLLKKRKIVDLGLSMENLEKGKGMYTKPLKVCDGILEPVAAKQLPFSNIIENPLNNSISTILANLNILIYDKRRFSLIKYLTDFKKHKFNLKKFFKETDPILIVIFNLAFDIYYLNSNNSTIRAYVSNKLNKLLELNPEKPSMKSFSPNHSNIIISNIWYSFGNKGNLLRKKLKLYLNKISWKEIILLFILNNVDIR